MSFSSSFPEKECSLLAHLLGGSVPKQEGVRNLRASCWTKWFHWPKTQLLPLHERLALPGSSGQTRVDLLFHRQWVVFLFSIRIGFVRRPPSKTSASKGICPLDFKGFILSLLLPYRQISPLFSYFCRPNHQIVISLNSSWKIC